MYQCASGRYRVGTAGVRTMEGGWYRAEGVQTSYQGRVFGLLLALAGPGLVLAGPGWVCLDVSLAGLAPSQSQNGYTNRTRERFVRVAKRVRGGPA